MAWFDALMSLAAITIAVVVTDRILHHPRFGQHVFAVAILWSVLMAALWSSNVYSGSHRGTRRTLLEIARVCVFVALCLLAVDALSGPWFGTRMPPANIVAGIALAALGMMACRVAILYRKRGTGVKAERVIVVGSGLVAQDIVSRLEWSGRTLVLGLVDDGPESGEDESAEVIGSIGQLPELCREHGVNRVIVAFTHSVPEQLLPVLRVLPESVAVDLVPRYFELVGWGARIKDFSGLSLVELQQRCRPARRDRIKRAFDLVVGGLIVIAVSPFLLVGALAVLVTSGRPVFFRQERLGRGRTPFKIMKLRTLVASEGDVKTKLMQSGTILQSEIVEGRMTPVGRILRRTGFDELPQLFNILAGHMSLVGPRPFIPEECWALTGQAERRFDVRPGMTGLWQVSGQHSLGLHELIRLDAYYVDTWTFWSDLRILAKTPSRLWRGGGDGVAKLVLESSSS
jgi:exopolysaccharide biosynthesis polyprenyl glycosylphosphotransferase